MKKIKFNCISRTTLFLLLAFSVWFSPRVQAQNCTVNSGVHQTICENEVLTLYGSVSGVLEEENAVKWTQVAGPSVVIESPTSIRTEVTGITPGDYTFRLSTTCLDGSLVYQDVTNTVLPITESYAGEDLVVCSGGAVLNAAAPGQNETGRWIIIEPNHGISITDETSATSSLTADESSSGETKLVWVITNENHCSSQDTVSVFNLGGEAVFAGPKREISNCYSVTQNTQLSGSYAGSGINGQQGTWTLVSGPNIPVISNIHNNVSPVSNLIEGTYIFRWDVEGTCQNGTANDTIVVPPSTSDVTNAGGTSRTNIYCDGTTSIVLYGTFPQYTNETVFWEKVSGPDPVTITTPDNHVTSVEGLDGSSDYRFRYTISNALTNCSSSGTVDIRYAEGPSLEISTSRIDLACGEAVAYIPYSSNGDGIESWSIVSGPETDAYPVLPTSYERIIETSGIVAIPGLTSSGTYIIRLRKAAAQGTQCEAAFADVAVVVSRESSLSNAGTDQLLACNVDTTSLAGNPPLAGEGTWSQVSGPGQATISNINEPGAKLSNLINGTYTFRWIVSGGPFCSSNQDDVIVIVANNTPTQAQAGEDQEVCVNTPVYLNADSPVLNEWGEWSVIPEDPSIVFNDRTSPDTYVEGFQPNLSYQLVWTITNACGETIDTMTVTTNDTNGPIIADAGTDICLPSGTTSFSLLGNEPSLTGEWTQLNGAGATITNPTAASSNVTVTSDGTYYFEWAIYANGCNPTRDTVRVTIAPDVTEAVAGADQEICGNTAVLNANTPVSGTGEWLQIAGPGGAIITDKTSPTTQLSNLTDGVYEFEWLISNGACEDSRDTVKLFVSESPIPANAGSDMRVCGSTSLSLHGNPVAKGLWSVVSGPNTPTISDLSSPDATVTNMIMGTYKLSWTSYGGTFCESSGDTVEISITPAAYAGADQEFCEATTSVSLTGNINSTGTWTQVGDTPNIATISPSSPNTAIASDLVSGTYTFQYEINGEDCTSTDVMTVTLYAPPPIANAGGDAEYCDATSFTLTGNSPEESDGEWTILVGPSNGSFNYVNDSVAVFTPDGSNIYGTYLFTWKLSNGDCQNEDQLRINNYAPASGNAGEDITLSCESSVFLDGVLNAGTGNWTFISATGDAPTPTIISPVLPGTEITGLGAQSNGDPAVYEFEWTITNGASCEIVKDTVTITVYQAPTEAFAGNDAELCNAENYALNATSPTVGTGEWVEVKGPNSPTIADVNSASTTVSGLIPGTYTFYWETTTEFCSSIDSVIVTNYEEPSDPDDLVDFEVCQFENLVLSQTTPASGSGKWSQISGPSATILNPQSETTQVVGIQANSDYTFRWTISNGVCAEKTDDVTVTVLDQPTMSNAGADQFFCNQTVTTLNGNEPVVGTGTWTVESSTGGTPAFADANSYNTEVSGLTAGDYTLRWTISNNNACNTYDEMQVTVYPDITISTPVGGEICAGGTFELSATANGGTGAYSYQWQDSISGGNWADIAGATSATYTTPGSLASGTYYYRVVVSDCNTIISEEAEVVVTPDVTISVQPQGATLCQGSSHTMNVSTDDGVNVTYQWQQSSTGTSGWSNISGATASTYTTDALSSTTYFRVRINDNGNGCANRTSAVATVNIPGITIQPEGAVICDEGTHTMTVSTQEGGGLAYSFQWQQSTTTGGPWTDIADETSASYTTGNLSTGNYYYQCIITPTTPDCAPLTSSEVHVEVVTDPQVTDESGDATICSGGTATHSVTVAGGTTGQYSYQWQISTTDCNTGFTDISGANSATYTTPAITTTGTYHYQCVITQPQSGCEVVSACKTVTVVDDPQVDIQPLGTTICSGETHSMNVSASGGTGAFSYQWQDSISGGSWTDIAGATADAYTTDALTTKTYFRAVIEQEGVGCDVIYSDAAEVAVPEISTQPTGGFVCEQKADTLSISVDAGSATLNYQWQSSDFDCNSGWFDIADATDTFYVTNNLPVSGTRYFRCIVSVSTPDCNDLISDCVPITITGCDPIIGVSNQLVTVGDNGNGTWDALFTVRVQNYGGTELNDIQVTQNLDDAFGAGNYIVEEITSTSFAVNTEYDGTSRTEMLTPTGNSLQPGTSTDIVLKVTILNEGNYSLSATGTGDSPDGTTVSDVSQNGSDPDPDQDGDPTANNDPTPVSTSCTNATANAGPDAQICAGSNWQIVGAEVSNEKDFMWTTSGDGTFNSTSLINPVYTPGANDISSGSVQLILIANSYGSCPVYENGMELIIHSFVMAEPAVTDANCDSKESGTVQLSVISGGAEPFNYELSTGESNTTGYFETLAAGGYIYRVTDANGCAVNGSFEIDDPNELELTVLAENDVTCYGGTNGNAILEATGGTAPYTFTWTGGITPDAPNANPKNLNNLPAGFYVVTVTDANGCVEIESLEIEEPEELSIILVDQENPDCDNSGQLRVNGTGGTPPYSFAASTGTVSENTISDLSAGTVTITITDKNGCTGELSVTLHNDDTTEPTFTCPATQTLYADDNCQATVPDLTALVTDAADNCSTGNITISQSIPQGTVINSDLSVTISVSDENGNTASCDVLLLVEDNTAPVAVCKDITLNLDMTGTVNITPQDIDGGSSDNCGLASLDIDIATFTCDNLGENTVVLTATDNAGNSATCEATVTLEDNINPVLDCPAPVTLVADADCQALVPDFATALSSNNCGNATVTQSPAAGTVISIGVTTVTITATDDSGNFDECPTTVTVVDETEPTFTCPATQTLYADDNCQATVPDLSALVTDAADNCSTGNITITQSIPQGTVINSDLSVTISVSDENGNTETCDVLLLVKDNTAPVAVCKDITLNLDMTGTVNITPQDIDGGSSDNCGLASLDIDIATFTCDNLGENTVVLTATDNAGNSATCEATVTIEDNINPVLDCPAPVTLVADADCQALVPDFATALSSNNCGNATVTQSPAAGTVISTGVTTVTITATDDSGNFDECPTTVTVVDETEPTFTCPATQTLYADDNCQATVPDLTALVTDAADNCSTGNITITQSIPQGTVINSDLSVTISVSDENGNTASCDVLLLVEDNTAPVAICKDITLNLDMTGTVNITPQDIDSGSSDNCGLASLNIDIATFTCDNLGENTVVLTATDNAGNTATCEATVTIEDNINPVLDCPAPVTLVADADCQALVPDFATALSSNNCGNATVTQSPAAGTVISTGVTTVTITATDDSGNFDECPTTVTVVDETEPAYVCSPAISINTDEGSCTAEVELVTPEINDNCDAANIEIRFRVFNPDNSVSRYFDAASSTSYTFTTGISQLEWNMTDQAGNLSKCLQEVVVSETELPQIMCPEGTAFIFESNATECGYTVADASLDATATDNCGLVSLQHDFYGTSNRGSLRGATFPTGTTTVTWTATDINGNSSSCSTEITVNDVTSPEFVNCPEGNTLTVALFSGICEGGTTWSTPIATDNCGDVVVTQTAGPVSGSVLAVGNYPIEYTATDASGNEATCSFTLNVIDSEGPVIVCPTDITENSDDGVCTWTAPEQSLTPLLAASNCPFDVTYEITGATSATGIDDASGTEFNSGTSTVAYTITEPASGQTWNCNFNVTITDNERPQVTCPAPILESNISGLCSAELELDLPEYTDNCDADATIRYLVYGPDNSIKGPFNGTENTFEFGIGISQVLWIVTDDSGNETTCTQEVTITESDAPVLQCTDQDEYIFNSTPGLCGYRIPDTSLDVSATDNCHLLSVNHNFGGWGVQNSLEGAVFPVGSTEVTWTAADASGNSVSCSFTVTVIDNETPEFINCPEGKTFTVGLFTGACEGGAIWSIPVAYDACSDVTVTQINGPEQGSVLGAGTYTVEYEATDASGNSTTCGFNVIVTDTEEPVIVCQPDIEKTADAGTCTWKSPANSLSPLLANSNCPASVRWRITNPDGSYSTGFDDASGYTFEPGTSTVHYSITENTSNQHWDCSFKVTVTDTEKPAINCPAAITVMAPPGQCEADIELEAPDFSDNCTEDLATVTFVVYAPDNSSSEEISVTTATTTYRFMEGISRVEWRVTDAAGNPSVCWQSIWVNSDKESLTPDAGANATICEQDSFEITEASAPDYATVTWTTNGTGSFVDATLANPVYVPSESDILDGFVVLTITASSSCESVSDYMVLSITQTPHISAGNDAEICESDTYQLNGSISNNSFAAQWETRGTGTFNNPTAFNPVYTPGAEDVETGFVTLVFRGISSGSCDDAVDSLRLTIHRQPAIFAGEDASVCGGASFTLTDATLENATAVIWTTSGTGAFTDRNVINTTYVPSESDIINGNVVLTATHNSNNQCATVSDEMVLTFSRHPEVEAGNDLFICFGEEAAITGATALNVSSVVWSTNGKGTIESATSLTPQYIPAPGETGEITLTVTATGNGSCVSETASDDIVVTIYKELIVDAGDNDTIFHNSSERLSVTEQNGSGSYLYSWQPANLVLSSNSGYTETTKLSATQEFNVTVKDAVTGCVAYSSKTVVVENSSENMLNIFNGFSPNGDGTNDNWQIEGIEKFPDNEVLIFNRWGDKVKALKNYDNVNVVWDGTNNRDELLPDGTYYYIVTLIKETKSYTGWVHIRSEN
ncbi:gliding motility-associated C-terminal domain-containing protein [Mariniphaga anaerophila]|uniref:Gliding motility-associated C-terminal domain-containing protein n=1 Tax=Mariniphaga anaerophila TaxID=1484053 RepID=A0A1M4ZSF1_9BACT|nr:HYR domain-containing protein [Mariniphaga anaerophila]SHF20993.1 gliding motility-associated C-terminal domain-containing protein [Mariniphaga anaerophila]